MKKGSIKRIMNKSISLFRKELFSSLQNIRFKRKEDKEILRKANMSLPKKNVAPQPPNIPSTQNKENKVVPPPVKKARKKM